MLGIAAGVKVIVGDKIPRMGQTLYDAEILQQQADALYSQARAVVFVTVTKYVAVTIVVVFIALTFLSKANPELPVGVLSILSALIAAGLGVSAGRAKALHLKLEAQTLLCQRQIELNTRPIGKLEPTPAPANVDTAHMSDDELMANFKRTGSAIYGDILKSRGYFMG